MNAAFNTALAAYGSGLITHIGLFNGSTEVSWSGAVVESTKVQFVTLAGTLDQAGEWLLQAKVVLASGTWLGETARLTVYRPFA